jgi:hypothetical protein
MDLCDELQNDFSAFFFSKKKKKKKNAQSVPCCTLR